MSLLDIVEKWAIEQGWRTEKLSVYSYINVQVPVVENVWACQAWVVFHSDGRIIGPNDLMTKLNPADPNFFDKFASFLGTKGSWSSYTGRGLWRK